MMNIKMSDYLVKGNVEFNGKNVNYRVFEKGYDDLTFGFNRNEREFLLIFNLNHKPVSASFIVDLEDNMVANHWLNVQNDRQMLDLDLYLDLFHKIEDKLVEDVLKTERWQ